MSNKSYICGVFMFLYFCTKFVLSKSNTGSGTEKQENTHCFKIDHKRDL